MRESQMAWTLTLEQMHSNGMIKNATEEIIHMNFLKDSRISGA